jgi:hypothetical protein
MALTILGSMFVVYQDFILFRNVLSWIGREALPMDLSYSLYAILGKFPILGYPLLDGRPQAPV